MFGRKAQRATPKAGQATTRGNWLAPRTGELLEDTFPWEDELAVAAAEARREHRSGDAPSVVLEPSVMIESLGVYGIEVLDLAD
jgi:hypothetical protein